MEESLVALPKHGFSSSNHIHVGAGGLNQGYVDSLFVIPMSAQQPWSAKNDVCSTHF